MCFAEQGCKCCSEPRPELLYENTVSHFVEAQLIPATPFWPCVTICIPGTASMAETWKLMCLKINLPEN